jgi:hypothetical protein
VKEPTDMYDLHLKILSFKRKQIQTKIVGLINELDWIQIQNKNGSTNPIETLVWDTIVKRNFYSIESTLLQTKYPGSYWLT